MKHKVYKVDAVEHGEFFYFHFKTLERNLSKVRQLAIDCADGWGAEVIEFEDITKTLSVDEINDVYEQL